jgi:hypothetical protein
VTITSPVGGETWKVGEIKNITWTKVGSIANVKLEYSTNSGATYPNVIIASTGAGNLSYAWTVADAIGTQVRVRVSDALDATVKSDSAADFTVRGTVRLTAPNGGEVWTVNDAHDIACQNGSYAT